MQGFCFAVFTFHIEVSIFGSHSRSCQDLQSAAWSLVSLKLPDYTEVAMYIHKCYLSVESGRETLHELQLIKVSHYFSKSLKYNSMVNLKGIISDQV